MRQLVLWLGLRRGIHVYAKEAQDVASALAAAMHMLSKQGKTVLEIFRNLDADGSGDLDPSEFQNALHEMDVTMSENFMRFTLSKFKSKPPASAHISNRVNYRDFLASQLNLPENVPRVTLKLVSGSAFIAALNKADDKDVIL